jgi:hypothetical protein
MPPKKRTLYYTLDSKHRTIPVDTPHTSAGAQALEAVLSDVNTRRVDETFIGTTRISTVFLCLDHSFMRTGPPILFETMIFSDNEEINDYQKRYTTWAKAKTGHKEAVNLAKEVLLKSRLATRVVKNRGSLKDLVD